ncbi:MAG: hypothetical protein ACKO3K_18430 [Cuspidothrix sp.]
MVVERKSAVSTKKSWFRPNPPLLFNRRRSGNWHRKTQSSSQMDTEAIPNTSSNHPYSWISFLGARRNKITRTATSETAKTPSTYSHRESSPSIPTMGNTGNLPMWLVHLYKINRYSSVVAFLLVVATLMVYGWTVYSQELWSESYRKLQSLQRHERQLNTANATLTSKMAQEAETPGTGLVSPKVKGTIFLAPSSSNQNSSSSFSESEPPSQQESPAPLGY